MLCCEDVKTSLDCVATTDSILSVQNARLRPNRSSRLASKALTSSQQSFCLDIGLEDITIGEWFSVEVVNWDNTTIAWVPFGTLSFRLDSILPIPSGSWDLKDVNGTTITSGSWSPPSF